MNRLRYIFALAVISLTWCACEHNTELENVETAINVPKEGYIFFDTEITTRGALIQDYLHENFAVLGYKYTANEWTTVEPQASQIKEFIHNSATTKMGVFDNIPQTVEWNGTVHSYSPVKEWDKDLIYSFFAWYPATLSSSGESHEGNPYITYSLNTTDPANHQDVMTACVIDTKSSSSKSVSFQMKHRLSALDIVARSYVSANTLGLDAGATANVKINSVGLKLNNMLYNQVQIPLNTEDATEQMVGSNTSGSTTVDFGTLVSGKTIDYYSSSANLAMLTNDVTKTLLLIPQSDELKCTVSVSYDIVNDAGESIWEEVYENIPEEDQPQQNSETEVSIKELKEGMYYYLLLNFTKSGITVVVLESEAWEDTLIDYEFN